MLSKDKMTDVMVDISIANQVVNMYNPEDRDSIRILLTQSILKVHNLTQTELDTNIYLYMSDFEKFRPLSEEMIQKFDSLSTRLKE